jgi:hypothetical protein
MANKENDTTKNDEVFRKQQLKENCGWRFAKRIEEIGNNQEIYREIFKSPRMNSFATFDPNQDILLQEARAYTNGQAGEIRNRVFSLAVAKTAEYFLANGEATALPEYKLAVM